MERFNVGAYLILARATGVISSIPRTNLARAFPPDEALNLRELLANFEPECEAMGLKASRATLRTLSDLLANTNKLPTAKDIASLLDELQGRLKDEMLETVFLSLSASEAHLLTGWADKWETVLDRFPGAVRDVEEAGKCLALERNTASVFHLMRIAELGLRTLGRTLNDLNLDPKRNPTWEAILSKCDKELQKPLKDRSAEWRADGAFFSAATANLRAVKDAWRNPTLHIEKHYDGEEARDIYNAVRAFMRHLATRLEEHWSLNAARQL